MTAAKEMYETLKSAGCRHLFGMDSPEALYDAVDRDSTQLITIRDERSGVVMADAYARVTGAVGVCTSVRGPGATNLVSGLAEAKASSSAVMAIVSDVSDDTRGRHQIQEIDQLALFEPVTKWTARVDRPGRAVELTRRGLWTATSGRPGPVVLSCPDDVLAMDEPQTVSAASVAVARVPAHRPAADPAMVARAADILTARPGGVAILVGSGVLLSSATAELRELAELLGAPVATTPQGKGAFDETHPLSIGVTSGYNNGVSGCGETAAEIINAAGAVLLVGSKADSIATVGWTVPLDGPQLVRIDVEADEVGRNYASALPVLGDAKLVLAALVDELRARSHRPGNELADRVAAARRAWRLRLETHLTRTAEPIRPERLVAELNAVLTDDTIISTDASYSAIWPMDLLQLKAPGRRFLSPRGFAGLGWGLPAAIGAKVARPDAPVVCVTGDGGFGYVFQELETAARYGIAVVVIVLNNQSLGYQKHYEELAYGRQFDTDLLDVNHADLAKVLHCGGLRVDRPGDFADALEAALASGRTTVLDCVVDQDSFPPIGAFNALTAGAGHPTAAIPVH